MTHYQATAYASPAREDESCRVLMFGVEAATWEAAWHTARELLPWDPELLTVEEIPPRAAR